MAIPFVFNIVLGLIVVLSLSMNLLMLITLVKTTKSTQQSVGAKSKVLLNLAVVDLIQVLLGYSSQFVDSVLASHSLNYCTVSGFSITMCGLVSMALFTMLSVDISFHVCRPLKSMAYQDWWPILLPAFAWLYGFIWAVVPFFGLGGYVLEGERSCSLRWTQDTLQGKVFILALLFGCFLLPLVIILTCFACIHLKTKRSLQEDILGKSTFISRRMKIVLRSNARLCFFMSFTFVAAWTPYSIVSVIISVSGYDAVPQVMLLAAAFMGKLSTVFNPLVYFHVDKTAWSYLRSTFGSCVSKSHRRRLTSSIMTRFSFVRE